MTRRIPILYRWWDADGKILYIGKSIAVLSRAESHRNRSKFFDEAVMMTMERYPDELTLAQAEVAAINAERPPYNVAHNREVEMPHDPELEHKMHVELAQAIEEIMAPIAARLKERAA